MTFSDTDFDYLTTIVAEAAAQEILPRFRNLDDADISEKTSAIDLVTEADLLAEKHITAALKARFPSALIVGEEAYEADKSVVSGVGTCGSGLYHRSGGRHVQFRGGTAVFGTIVAVVAKARPSPASSMIQFSGIVSPPCVVQAHSCAGRRGRRDGFRLRQPLRSAP